MLGDGSRILHIANPMTENYEYVRDTVLASLMMSESVSGNAAYPHRIFEVGKVAYRSAGRSNTVAGGSKATAGDTIEGTGDSTGTRTRQYLGFVHAGADANFNTLAAQLQTLFYYLSRDYTVEESADSRFIPGRAAAILFQGAVIGVFGEVHPQVLENWGIAVPCTAAEIDIEALLYLLKQRGNAMDDDTLIKELEEKLLAPAVRGSREELEKLISPEFIEYGSSGKIYNFLATITSLIADSKNKFNYSFVNFKTRRLSDDAILALYILETEKNHHIAIANRSSVWHWEEGSWRIIFHQGTKVTK
jgi:hypothetical protein